MKEIKSDVLVDLVASRLQSKYENVGIRFCGSSLTPWLAERSSWEWHRHIHYFHMKSLSLYSESSRIFRRSLSVYKIWRVFLETLVHMADASSGVVKVFWDGCSFPGNSLASSVVSDIRISSRFWLAATQRWNEKLATLFKENRCFVKCFPNRARAYHMNLLPSNSNRTAQHSYAQAGFQSFSSSTR